MKCQSPKKSFGRFLNPYNEEPKHNLWDVILWRFGHYDEHHQLPPSNFVYPSASSLFVQGDPSALWIGHSTFLLQAGGIHFLTDPLFSSHCSPIPIRSLLRRHEPALSIDAIHAVDVGLISHNHYDHLDEKSVLQLHKRFPDMVWVVPSGIKRWFLKRQIKNVHELSWGDRVTISEGCHITAVPAQHFSGRGLWDENLTLWCGYVVEVGGKVFYFAGDTGYNGVDFKNIGDTWERIDLSLLPIGAYAPKRLMRSIHVSPQEAVQIHEDVHSRLSLGMHWKTFSLSDEPMDLPPYDLYLSMQEKKLPFETFLPAEIGRYVNW